MSKTKSSAPAKLDLKAIAAKVETLGQLKDQIDVLKKSYDDLLDEVEPHLAAGDVIVSDHYRGTMVETTRRTINQDAARRALGSKVWSEIATVTIGALTNVMGKEDIDAVTAEFKTSVSLQVKPR